ncbi:hypothetical protein QA811_44100 [Streptomyces sp. B21-102]
MTQSTTIRWEQDRTGLVTLVLDDPDQSAFMVFADWSGSSRTR